MSEERWTIPASWRWATAGDIAKIVGGGTPSSKVDGNFAENGIPWITPADLTGYREIHISRGRRDLSEQGFAGSGAQLIPAGSVLFSSRAPIGYCVIASNEVSTNQGFKSLVLDGEIDPGYIRHYLLSAKEYAESKASGTTFMELSGARVAELAVPIAPLPEQRRIVAKVDGLTARTARASKELDRIPTLIARYKQRLLALAFSGELIGGDFGGSQVPLSSVVMRLDQGWSPKCENFPSEDPSIWGVIKTTAIQPVEFLEHENKQLPAHLEPRPRIEISAGEVLVTRAGPRNRVGIACYVRKTRPRLMLADKVYRLAIDQAKADPLYVTYMLNSPDALSVIEAMKSGGSESGLNLTQDKFLGLAIPVPSIPEQIETVRRIETAFGWLDRMAANHATAARLLPKLDSAILAKAFRGELVPQDPNDEPAAKVLERIKAEREATPKENSGRGRKAKLPPITASASGELVITGSATVTVGPRKTGKDAMSKSRHDDDVKGKPYLASLLKSGRFNDVQNLFRAADLPVAEFYKQLAWEIDKGHILDSAEELKAA